MTDEELDKRQKLLDLEKKNSFYRKLANKLKLIEDGKLSFNDYKKEVNEKIDSIFNQIHNL